MAKNDSIALEADPADPDDFAVSMDGVAGALAERAVRRAKIGRPAGSTREQVALRIETAVLARWRAGGPGWQTRMTRMLQQVTGTGSIIADATRGQGAGARLSQIAA